MSPERVVFMSPPMLGTYALLKTVNFTRPWLKLAFFRTRNIKFHNCFHCIHSMCVGGGGQFFSVKNDKNPKKKYEMDDQKSFSTFSPFHLVTRLQCRRGRINVLAAHQFYKVEIQIGGSTQITKLLKKITKCACRQLVLQINMKLEAARKLLNVGFVDTGLGNNICILHLICILCQRDIAIILWTD